jgi:adenylate cyclase
VEHYGRIVKRTGNRILVEFGSAVEATPCAVQTQQGMAKRNKF